MNSTDMAHASNAGQASVNGKLGRVLVIGHSHHNTLGIIRSLGLAGIKPEVLLAGEEPSYIDCTVYASRVVHYATAEQLVGRLVEEGQEGCPRPVVLTTSDDIAALADKKFEVLGRYYHIFNCGSSGRITTYMDKQEQVAIASSVGLKVPQGGAEMMPCIVKPKESIHGGKKIVVCRSQAELERTLSGWPAGSTPLVQQYVHRDREIVLVGCSAGNDVVMPAYVLKHRDVAGGTSFSSVRPIGELPAEIADGSRRLVQKMQYQGLFGIEFIESDGQYYFVEINLRADATTYSIMCAGCNLPLIWVKACRGIDWKQDAVQPIEEILSMVEMRDFYNVLKGKLSPVRWRRDYRAAACRYFHNPDDLGLFRAARSQQCRAVCRKVFNKIEKPKNV